MLSKACGNKKEKYKITFVPAPASRGKRAGAQWLSFDRFLAMASSIAFSCCKSSALFFGSPSLSLFACLPEPLRSRSTWLLDSNPSASASQFRFDCCTGRVSDCVHLKRKRERERAFREFGFVCRPVCVCFVWWRRERERWKERDSDQRVVSLNLNSKIY